VTETTLAATKKLGKWVAVIFAREELAITPMKSLLCGKGTHVPTYSLLFALPL